MTGATPSAMTSGIWEARAIIQAATPDAAMRLAETLATVPGVDASYREFPGLGHGPMFRASLMGALHAVTGVADRSDTPRPPAGE